MLEVLHIENIAIIEEADIRFEPGFNALTGETGAGKSIVIDALGAVLGQRASRELIRTGMDKAFVSAVFSGVDNSVPEALGITPEEFFRMEAAAPQRSRELLRELEKLTPEQTEHILQIVRDLSKQ